MCLSVVYFVFHVWTYWRFVFFKFVSLGQAFVSDSKSNCNITLRASNIFFRVSAAVLEFPATSIARRVNLCCDTWRFANPAEWRADLRPNLYALENRYPVPSRSSKSDTQPCSRVYEWCSSEFRRTTIESENNAVEIDDLLSTGTGTPQSQSFDSNLHLYAYTVGTRCQ